VSRKLQFQIYQLQLEDWAANLQVVDSNPAYVYVFWGRFTERVAHQPNISGVTGDEAKQTNRPFPSDNTGNIAAFYLT